MREREEIERTLKEKEEIIAELEDRKKTLEKEIMQRTQNINKKDDLLNDIKTSLNNLKLYLEKIEDTMTCLSCL